MIAVATAVTHPPLVDQAVVARLETLNAALRIFIGAIGFMIHKDIAAARTAGEDLGRPLNIKKK